MNAEQAKILVQAVEQSPVPIMVTDTSGSIQYVNPRFLERTGYSEEELVGENPRILASGKTAKQTYKDMWEHILAGKIWKGDLFNKRKNGEVFLEIITIVPIKDPQGEINYFFGIWTDVEADIMRGV